MTPQNDPWLLAKLTRLSSQGNLRHYQADSCAVCFQIRFPIIRWDQITMWRLTYENTCRFASPLPVLIIIISNCQQAYCINHLQTNGPEQEEGRLIIGIPGLFFFYVKLFFVAICILICLINPKEICKDEYLNGANCHLVSPVCSAEEGAWI